MSVHGSPATSRESPKYGKAAAHAAASVVSVNDAPMKHSSLKPEGLSSSTFCESGTSRVSASIVASHASIVRNDFSVTVGGGPMPKIEPFHVQMS